MNTHPYVGMWVTADGHIRHELLASGRMPLLSEGALDFVSSSQRTAPQNQLAAHPLGLPGFAAKEVLNGLSNDTSRRGPARIVPQY